VLNHLHVRNLAVVDEVEVELTAGMTVLTGETGAGKSILVDALGLALGERADSDAVRPGAKRAEITASFELSDDEAATKWLDANDLDQDGGCVLRRVVTAEGRSRGYINGNPAPMQTLRELGELLVDICGQQAHQSLSRPDNQRNLLDQHDGGATLKLLAKVRSAYSEWHEWQSKYEKLEAARSDQAARIDLLSFQVQELEALNAQPGELEELDHAHKRAANASRITEGAGAALQMLYENEQASAHDLLNRARSNLEALAELDPTLGQLNEMLNEADIQITEAADTLRHYLDQDQPDASNLAQLDSRLGAMHDLARKHRIEAKELPELTERLREELYAIEHADDTLEDLRKNAETSADELQKLCKKLSAIRKKAAASLGKQVSGNMQQLGMPDGSFSIELLPLDAPGPAGSERVEFLVSINPGMKPGALTKVASGGELSRVSLAIQVAASDNANTPTLIFDEVDAGVGGSTADIVGEKLRSLAANSQVLCVTHLPQVASKGHEQFRVSKLSDGENTRTRVAHLNQDERVEELARMLGGVEITDRTRDHAAEMLGINDGRLSSRT
jgi:DNA repair protein RecN (Recombination protein N)